MSYLSRPSTLAGGATVAPIARQRGRHVIILSLLAILGTAAGFRMVGTADRSLWFDEAFSWRLASFPPGEIVARSAADNNPPLYYLALKLWMSLVGESTVAIRLLSVLAGLVSCLGAYLLVREAYGGAGALDDWTRKSHAARARWIGACAAALIAASSYQIRWGWEARMYTLGAALAVGSSWLLLRALRSEGPSYWRWSLYSIAALLFLYTHTYAVFSVAAQWLYAAAWLWVRGPRRSTNSAGASPVWGAALGAGLIAAAWSPWLFVLLGQAARVRQTFWSGTLDRWDLPHFCHQMLVSEDAPLTHVGSLTAAVACIVVLVQLLWRPREGDWLLFLMAGLPVVGGLLVSSAGTNILHPRYLLFAHVFLLIALARLIGRIPALSERTAVAGVLLTNMLFVHMAFWQRLEISNRPGVRAAARYIEQRREENAPIVVASPFFFSPVLYHLTNRTECYLLDDGKGFPHYQGTAALKPADFFAAGRLPSLRSTQIWVVNNRSSGVWGDHAVAVPSGWAKREHRTFLEAYDVQGQVEVIEYKAR
ncbi:MAG TPA: glycosyltransferase family 39 protein [Pirellulales bacterium]|nr:glycosyltransferase family 39 protein [Pirellulales bacterium]